MEEEKGENTMAEEKKETVETKKEESNNTDVKGLTEEEKDDVSSLVELNKEEKENKPEEENPSSGNEEVNDEETKPAEEKNDTIEKLSEAKGEVEEEAEEEEEARKESQTEMSRNSYRPLKKSADKDGECEQNVNKMQAQFNSDMKKSRNFSTIVMAVMLLGIIGGFMMYRYLPEGIRWLTWVLFGVLAVILIVAFVLVSRKRKKLYTDVEKYVDDAIGEVDSYVFTDDEFLNPVYTGKSGHIDLNMIIDAHYFDTINAVNSRNIVKVNYLEREMTVSEIAARMPYQVPSDGTDHTDDKKKSKETPSESYGIFGKYVTYPLTLKSGNAVIGLLHGKNAYLPTYLDGYREIKVEGLKENYSIWAKDDDVKDFFTPEVIALLNGFNSDECLENIFFSINEKGLKFALNYNETVMEVPMDKPVKGTPYVHYRNDIQNVKKLIAELRKVNG